MSGGKLLRPISRWPWPPIVLLLLGLATAGIGTFAFIAQSGSLEQHALADLETIAQLKVEAIARTLEAARSRADIFGHSPVVTAFLQHAGSGAAADPAQLSAFLNLSQTAERLRGLAVIGPDGRILLGHVHEPEVWSAAAARAIASGRMDFVDFHSGADGSIEVGFVTPVLASGDGGPHAVGAVAVAMPEDAFDPALTTWPSTDRTGRAVLVRRSGDQILYVGQFDAGRDQPPTLRQGPLQADPLAAHVLNGDMAPASGRDARGVRVLAAAALIPGTPWFLIAEIDRREALAEASRLGVAIGLLMAAVLAAVLIFVFWLEQRRRLQMALADMAREQALQAAETQFRAVFDNAGVGIVLAAPDRRVLRANRRMCAMLDYPEAELTAMRIEAFTDPEDIPSTLALLHGLQTGESEHVEVEKRYRRRDGGAIWASTVVRLVRKPDGSPDYLVAVVQDVSQRKHAEARLRDSEERIRQVVESAPNAMLMIDRAGIIRMANRAAETLFAGPRSRLLGAAMESVFPDSTRDRYHALHAAFLQRGQPDSAGAEANVLIRRHDGSEVPVEISITPIAADGGVMALWTLLDLTERLKHEDALRRSEEQLAQSQKLEAIGSLTGGIAHDFNNLLSVIIINLDLAQSILGESSGPADLIRQALGAALRGADLTRRLLAFARRQPLRPQRVDLNEIVAGTVQMLGRTLGANIQVVPHLAESLWPVMIDPVQVESALTNLATNARDAMPSGGTITIATDNRQVDTAYADEESGLAPGDYVMIEVSDTGSGMTPDLLAHIFEPFFTTKEVGRGTGLGLSMVFGFIKQSGGHVSVYSEPGFGTTFRLYLPRLHTSREPGEGAAAVLLVEGAPTDLSAATEQLEQQGYRVQSARNATEALHLLSRERFDLVFSDVRLPGEIDGFSLAHRIVKDFPGIKVVLASGLREPRAGADPHALPAGVRLLSKPYRPEDLIQVLRDALGT